MKNKLNIIKIGGSIVSEKKDLNAFLKKFSQLDGKKILVHGGGKIATELSKKWELKPEIIAGRRITSKADLKIMLMAYAGVINKTIVAKLQGLDVNAIGLSGADACSIIAEKRKIKKINFKQVGDIVSIDIKIIDFFLKKGLIPVFCSITHDKKGRLFNTNADTIASSLAMALRKKYEVNLIYCFEKKGILKNQADDSSVIPIVDYKKYQKLKEKQIISQGMLPKIENGYRAVKGGIKKVIISDIHFLETKNQLHTRLVI